MTSIFGERRPFPGQDPWVVPFDGDLLLVQSTAGTLLRFTKVL